MANDLIIPGRYGIGTRGFGCDETGYRRAAKALVSEHTANRHVDPNAFDTRKIMEHFGAVTMAELELKMRNY